MSVKITEKEISSQVNAGAYVLITQQETVNGVQKECLRRVSLASLAAILNEQGYIGGLAFDGGFVNEEGMLHLTLDGVDIDGFEPFFVGTGGGGSAVAGINLSDVVKATSIRNGENAIFGFTATSTDDTNITVKWYVDNILRQTDNDVASGSSFSFNAKNYLKPSDSSTVKAVITSESAASITRSWSVVSTAFALEWGEAINPIMLYTANENVYIPVNVSAQSGTENIVTLYIGEEELTKNIVGSGTVTFEIDKSLFEVGVNGILAEMVSSTDETDTADPILFVAIWGYGATDPIVAFSTDEQNASQYDTTPIVFMVYDPDNEIADCTLQIGSEAERELSVNRTIQALNYVPSDYGTKTVTLTCGEISEDMILEIAQSQYNIGKVTGDNLRYEIDPTGHSNTDADKRSFGGLTFSTGFDWLNGGFQQDADGASAFVVKKGHRATLPRGIFEDADGNGKTIDISFKIRNSDLYSAVAMSELNSGESKGLILRANEGELRLNNTTGQLFRYCEESRIDLSVNVEAVNDHRVMTVWLDGIPSLVNTYAAGTLVQTDNTLVIGSDNCDVWIYAVRVYNTALTRREMIQNYISLGSTTAVKVARCQENSIYNSNGVITPETLHAARPDLTIVQISAERMTMNKKDPVDATVSIRDGSTVLDLDSGTVIKVQGTSSAAYGRSAYNLDIDFKNSGKTYKLSSGALAVNYLNIKVNVASSENANNICAADRYNQFQPYLVPSRATSGVRDTVEGKPCAVFFTNTSNSSIWVGSQQLQPGDTVLYAMGDLCNSKKNLAVFGQDGEGAHPTKGCIEVSGNDTPAQQFKATSTYNPTKKVWETNNNGTVSTDYEWRMEPSAADLDEVVAAWNNAVAWLVSTDVSAATDEALSESVTYGGTTYTADTAAYRLAKFKAEFGNYFAWDPMLYHFLNLEYFEALDNVSKNTFYSYDWDSTANKYLWNICKNYDDDTILGCDNDGVPLVDYGTDYGDSSGGRSLFNADGNVIWSNIQSSCYDELSAMYIDRRTLGAWDASAIISKWDAYQSKRPHAAMAEDAYNKYILPYKTTNVIVGTEVKSYDDSYLARLQGSKTYQRRQFLTYQGKYMDGKYGFYSTSESITFRANAAVGTTQDLVIRVYAKTYVSVIVDNGTRVTHKIGTGSTETFEGIAVHSNATIYVTPDSLVQSITPINAINNSTFGASGASKLAEVILGNSESENTAWGVNTGLNIPSVVLKSLSIRNIVNFAAALDLSANVELESLDTRGTSAGRITLPEYAPLETIHLNECSGIVARNLNDVETFDMESGDNLESVILESCNSTLSNAIATYLADSIASNSSATKRIRAAGVAWSLDTADILIAIANGWGGYDAMGQQIADPVITGTCYIDSITTAELTAIQAAFPHLTITYGNTVPVYTVTFENYDGTVLNTQSVRSQSAAVNPVTAGLINTPVKEPTVSKSYTFTGWDKTFGSIMEDTTVTATFSEEDRYYTVTYLNGSVVVQTSSVIAGGNAPYTGSALTKSGQIWTGWQDSEGTEITGAKNVVSDMEISATFIVPTLPDSVATGYDYLYSDDPEDSSGYTFAEFIGIITAERAKSYFAVGDKIKIKPNGLPETEIVFLLYGFNHFKLAGSNDFASCVFGMKGVRNGTQQLSPTGSDNAGGWPATTQRTNLNTNVFNALPIRWQSVIKTVQVLSTAGNASSNVVSSNDKLFLFALAEYGLSATDSFFKKDVDPDAEQIAFTLFTTTNSRIKKTNNGSGTATQYWTRSPEYNSTKYFRNITTSGNSAIGTAYDNRGISFGFCI